MEGGGPTKPDDVVHEGGLSVERGGWYRRNRILIWVCALTTVNQLGFGSIVPVVPLYALSFHVPQSAIGLTIAIYGLARFLVNVPAGQLADRIGRRGTLTLGALFTVVGNLLCAAAPAYLPFLGARFVAGVGAALVLTASQVVLADISTPERRGRIMSVYSGVFAFAVGAGPYPGGLLAGHFGLAAPFYAFAILSAVAGLLAWFRVPETRGLRRSGRTAADVLPATPFLQQVRRLLAQRGFAMVSLVSFCAFFARTGALFNVIPVLAEQPPMRLQPDQIGLGLSFVSVAGFLLSYPSGVMADRFGRKAVIAPSTIISGLSIVLFALAPSFGWYLVACAVWSLALGISSGAPGAYAADMAPAGMNAAAMSTYRMLADAGYVVGPFLLGLIADRSGAVTALGFTAVLLLVSGALFAWLAPETYRSGKPTVELVTNPLLGDQRVEASPAGE